MKRHASLLAAALLMGVASWPAAAFQVGVGGVSISTGGGGGTSISAGSGGTSGGVSVGGDSIASVGGDSNGTGGSATITNNSGQLLGVDQSGNTTNGTVNLGLGNVLSGIANQPTVPTDQPAPLTALTAQQVATAYASLLPTEKEVLRGKCAWVMRQPAAFDSGLVTLCRLVAQVGR